MKKVSTLVGLHPHGRILYLLQSGRSERNILGFPGPWVLLVLRPFLTVFCLVPFLLLGLKVLVSLGFLEIQGLVSRGWSLIWTTPLAFQTCSLALKNVSAQGVPHLSCTFLAYGRIL